MSSFSNANFCILTVSIYTDIPEHPWLKKTCTSIEANIKVKRGLTLFNLCCSIFAIYYANDKLRDDSYMYCRVV